MSWWKGDPDLYRYYRGLDQKYDERRRKLDIDLLRTRGDLTATSHRVGAAERSQRRARYRHDAEHQRDWIEREFRNCAYFSKEACQDWADRTALITCVAADGAAQTRQLLDDFRAATERYQRDLRDLVLALGGQPPTGSRGLSLPGLGPSVNIRWLRAVIGTSRQLRDETLREWLADLPPPSPRGSIGLSDPPVSSLQDLQRKVALEARYAVSQADLICSSLELLETYITGSAG